MLENLKDLVAINSYDNGDIIIKYLKDKFSSFSEEIIIVENKENNNKSIIVGINTKLKDVEPILLSGHIDTVAPDYKKYKTNPLELTIKENKAYGLGSVDMKSFSAIIMDNIETLKSLRVPIVIALTTDEETDLICVEIVVKKFKELNIKPKFTIVGEPTKCEINNQANGCYEYFIEVLGKACHSSILSEGVNAISIMAKLVTFIEMEQVKYESLTSNCGVVSGGDIVNRVPDYCKLKFDVRSTNAKQVEEFISLVNKKIDELKNEYFGSKIEMKKTLEIPPLEIKNENIINKLASSLNLNVNKFMGGCEAGYYQSFSGDVIIFGVGDMALAHKPNEFVEIDEYKNYSKLLIKLINKIIEIYYV